MPLISGAVCSCTMAEMRGAVLFVVAIAGCGSGKNPGIDANMAADSAVDTGAAGCQPEVLLAGGTDVAQQGWSTVMQAPASLTYGPDYVQLTTSTTTNATTGGQLLLTHSSALEPGTPFGVQVVMLVETVTPHNPLDSAAAIMGAFTAPFGTTSERGQMIYLDGGSIGWADNTQAFTASIANNAYHIYELSVGADSIARVSVDGVQALTRNGFAWNGVIAIGDQTNEANVDSVLRLRSVTKLCP
jgi:hypothetical protein